MLRKEAEDGLLIYEPWTGQTQLLSHLAFFILDTLERQTAPISTVALICSLQAEEADASPEQCAEAVLGTLTELADAGLIDRYGPQSC
ncbi:PqqD family protein [Paucibacter sp. XJ19-41]|nr:PqqD family protein [Paucibacter sp. XJ19-41]